MSKKNNSPEQKAAWQANKKLGSRFVRVIAAPDYEAYRMSRASRYEYDAEGRRTK